MKGPRMAMQGGSPRIVAWLVASISALVGATPSVSIPSLVARPGPPAGIAPLEGPAGLAPAPAPAPLSAPAPGIFGAPAPSPVGAAPAPAPLPGVTAAPTPPQDPLAACFQVPRSLCLAPGDGNTGGVVVRPRATPPGLALWYEFDKALPVDESGNGRHLTDSSGSLTSIRAGPGVLGRGASIAFDGTSHAVVQGAETLPSDTFTVTLSLYLLAETGSRWRTIFSRGSAADALAPALLLRPDSRRLHVAAKGGSVDSAGLLPLKRWTHVAIVCAGGVLRLYINGLKDSEVILEESIPGAAADTDRGDAVFIGGDPWRAGASSFLDDFRWYNRPLAPAEVKAMTPPSMVGAGADFVRLGCISCSYPDAVGTCGRASGAPSHLCSAQELLAGGLQTARAMGWLARQPAVWHRSVSEHEGYSPTEQKLGLCCTE